MLQLTIGQTAITCLPENLTTLQTKLAKPPKGGTRQSAEKRKFPKHANDLQSTDAYVRAYLQLNGDYLAGYSATRHDHWILNTAPTTWPESPDCIIETVED